MADQAKPSAKLAKSGTKKSEGLRPRARRSTSNPAPSAVARIRMYCHGLGDCFLLRLPKADGAGTYNILIDCGLIGVAKEPKPLMEEVVHDLIEACGGHLDLVIVTHEHWDHVSGFSTQQAQALFDALTIDQAWYAWTEDPSPSNALGRRLRQEREAKARAVHRAALTLGQLSEPLAIERAQRIGNLLSFFGYTDAHDPAAAPLPAAADGGTIGKTRAAFDYLAKRRGIKVRYCRPFDAPLLLPGTGVRALVLGPPEDESLIKRSSPTKRGKEVYELAGADLLMDEQLEFAFERLAGYPENDAANCPFDPSFRRDSTDAAFDSPQLAALNRDVWDPEPWRQITHDWTAMAEALALNLDKHTNNTCLVVAFELEPNGRVLLFAADAQVGNWLSWQDLHWPGDTSRSEGEVTGPGLLARTVFYKVGHHGSHNATLRDLGLEQMRSEDLVAFVPVDVAQARKNRWNEMPFDPLMRRLREKTGGRVIISDSAVAPPGPGELAALSDGERESFLRQLADKAPAGVRLYYELEIPL